MRAVRVSQDIVPVTDFKARASEWLRRLADSDHPLVITQNGKPAAVLLSPRAFDALVERGRFLAAIDEGLADAEAGRVRPHREVAAELRKRFGHRTAR